MKKYVLSILLVSLIYFHSCIIESYPYLQFLEPLDYQKSVPLYGDSINSTVYIDEENVFSLTANCMESVGDSLDYYMLLFSLKNLSEDKIVFQMSKVEMYSEDYFLKPDEFTERKMIVGAYPSISSSVKDVTINPNDSLRYFIRFLFNKKNNIYESILSEKEADIVIKNILIEKGSKRISIPDFYFKN